MPRVRPWAAIPVFIFGASSDRLIGHVDDQRARARAHRRSIARR